MAAPALEVKRRGGRFQPGTEWSIAMEIDLDTMTRKEKLRLARMAGFSLGKLKGEELNKAMRYMLDRIKRAKEE